nr:ClassA_beta_lactamase [uncultured bacterium]
MRIVLAIAAIACLGALTWAGFSARDGARRAEAGNPTTSSPENAVQQKGSDADGQLTERLKAITSSAGGVVGLAVTHIESGRTVNIQGTLPLPLYSVFKLPLAVAVLKDVEENRLRLDRKVLTTPAEIVPGSQENTDLWRKPVERTVTELLELSVMRSDNTSADKLLQLVGGASAVTERMRSLGYQNLLIHSSVREYVADRKKVNTGTASDLTRLLVDLHQGRILQPPQLSVLLGFMQRATTGQRRLRDLLPAGTQVADKTGSGAAGVATNDVGLITLPKGQGHLAIAVLVSDAKLPTEEQEKLIAEVARVSYDAHLSQAAPATP